MQRDNNRYGKSNNFAYRKNKNSDTFAKSPIENGDEEAATNAVCGRNAVLELLKSGRAIDKLFVRKGDREGSITLIVAEAIARKIPVVEVEKNKIDALAVTDEEDIRKIALAMCQAEMHTFAVKYLDKLYFQRYAKNVMLLRAIAYYNSGNKKGAIAILKDMKKLFPKDVLLLSDTESKMKVEEVEILPYSVVMMQSVPV